jgi:UDP-3-O-[3-hydroxymyristoyl] glucosamine N-acyltransferase
MLRGASSLELTDVAALHRAGPVDLSFFDNRKYADHLRNSSAGAVVLREEDASQAPAHCALFITDQPYAVFARALGMFYPDALRSPFPTLNPGIAASATVAKTAQVSPAASVGERAVIGEGCVIGHGSVIGPGVVLGKNCLIGDHVTITHSELGDGCIVYPGVRIGQDGFGYAPSPTGIVKVPQLGRVLIGNHVEIGANCTIDRGSMDDTVIGDGTKLDNLVQIGHNARLGRFCIMVAQSGVAGSTHVGDGTVIGGQVGIAGHLTIGNRVQIAAQSGVAGDLDDGAIVGGTPAVPVRQWHKQNAILSKMAGGRIKA